MRTLVRKLHNGVEVEKISVKWWTEDHWWQEKDASESERNVKADRFSKDQSVEDMQKESVQYLTKTISSQTIVNSNSKFKCPNCGFENQASSNIKG